MTPSQNDKPVKRPKRQMKLPNGFGSVSFLGGNRRKPFAARKTVGHREDGTPIQKAIGYYHTRAEALQALAEYNLTPYTLERDTTLRAAFEACFRDKFNVKLADLGTRVMESDRTSSVFAYRSSWNGIPDSIKDTPLIRLTAKQLQDYIDTLPSAPRQSEAIRCFRLALKPAYKNGVIPRDVAGDLSETVKYQAKEKHVITSEEIQSLWNRLPDRPASQLLIMLYTGMRANELIKMDREQIFLDDGYMVGGSKTEAGRDRVIPIHPDIVPLVRELMVEKKGGGPLNYGALRYWMPVLLPGHTSHEARHTFITAWKTQRLDDMILADIVGHTAPTITEKVYTHRDPAVLCEEMAKFKYPNVSTCT